MLDPPPGFWKPGESTTVTELMVRTLEDKDLLQAEINKWMITHTIYLMEPPDQRYQYMLKLQEILSHSIPPKHIYIDLHTSPCTYVSMQKKKKKKNAYK